MIFRNNCHLRAFAAVYAVNFSKVASDYMFFKLESFIFAPLGAATQDWVSVILVYVAYLCIHALPYLPFLLIRRKPTHAPAN